MEAITSFLFDLLLICVCVAISLFSMKRIILFFKKINLFSYFPELNIFTLIICALVQLSLFLKNPTIITMLFQSVIFSYIVMAIFFEDFIEE